MGETIIRPFMVWLTQVLFGIIQGFTEVFPISSSAHLAVFRTLCANITAQCTVTFPAVAFLHLGTFCAIFIFYGGDVRLLALSAWRTLRHWPPRWEQRPSGEHPLGPRTPFLMLGSLAVTAAVGFALEMSATSVFGLPQWAAGLLIVNGILLLGTRRYSRPHAVVVRDIADLEWWHYALIGLAQGIAVLPGLSRFGLTLMVGLLCRLGWHQALRLSFLLSLPTVLGAVALEYRQLIATQLSSVTVAATLLGIIVACVCAWLGLRFIRREDLYAQQALGMFGLYCLAAGLFYLLYTGFWGR